MKKLLVGLVLGVVPWVLTGCGDPFEDEVIEPVIEYLDESFADDRTSAIEKRGFNSRAYEFGGTIDDVVKDLSDEQEPLEVKHNDNQGFIVYKNFLVHIIRNPNQEQDQSEKYKDDLSVEVDTWDYVRTHYDPDFLDEYITEPMLVQIFGGGWQDQKGKSNYYGYADAKFRKANPTTSYAWQYNPPKLPGPAAAPPVSSASVPVSESEADDDAYSTEIEEDDGDGSDDKKKTTTTKPSQGQSKSQSSSNTAKSSTGTAKNQSKPSTSKSSTPSTSSTSKPSTPSTSSTSKPSTPPTNNTQKAPSSSSGGSVKSGSSGSSSSSSSSSARSGGSSSSSSSSGGGARR